MIWDRGSAIRGQIKEAICEYRKMVTDDPSSIRTRLRLADLYVRINNVNRAIREYMHAAREYEAQDLIDRAISLYKIILRLDPSMAEVYHHLADLYRSRGLLGDARSLYQRIIELDPQDQIAYRAIHEIEKTLCLRPQHIQEEESAGLPYRSPTTASISVAV
jgi:tetratricopeptide (TPR) repeat protein